MNCLSVEVVKRYCAFALRIEFPLETMGGLMELFQSRRIYVESFQMQMIEGGEAKLLIFCLVEKDRISHTRHAMEKMHGVIELQLLENKETSTAIK